MLILPMLDPYIICVMNLNFKIYKKNERRTKLLIAILNWGQLLKGQHAVGHVVHNAILEVRPESSGFRSKSNQRYIFSVHF